MHDLTFVAIFWIKIPTSSPSEANVLSDLHFVAKLREADKKMFLVLKSVFNRISFKAKNSLTGVVYKKFENSSNFF